ncbi:MAG: hypothetical protein GXO80_01930 [Chlorobi bacterium]|nr:hypothetical protein [Chlorobiota bacterium]
MKLYKILFPIVILFLSLSSCIDEPAQPVSEKEIIDNISREWNCLMDEDGYNVDFNAVISPDGTNSKQVLINNFHKIGNDLSVYVIVNQDLTLEIPEQAVGNQVFKGTGLISDDYTEITWNYTIETDDNTVTQVMGKYSYGISA